MKFNLINKKTKEQLEVETEVLIQALFIAIEEVLTQVDALRKDLEDLTDFVEDNLD